MIRLLTGDGANDLSDGVNDSSDGVNGSSDLCVYHGSLFLCGC